MGERGNIKVGKVWLYTHWTGHKLKPTLQAALIRGKPRWSDESYLTRIIFCEMIKDDVLGETGYGISTKVGDNNYPVLAVDVKKQMVAEHEFDHDKWKLGKVLREWNFELFIKAKFKKVDEDAG